MTLDGHAALGEPSRRAGQALRIGRPATGLVAAPVERQSGRVEQVEPECRELVQREPAAAPKTLDGCRSRRLRPADRRDKVESDVAESKGMSALLDDYIATCHRSARPVQNGEHHLAATMLHHPATVIDHPIPGDGADRRRQSSLLVSSASPVALRTTANLASVSCLPGVRIARPTCRDLTRKVACKIAKLSPWSYPNR